MQINREGGDFNTKDSEGQTILIRATKDADCSIIQQILNSGKNSIDLDTCDKNGNSALSIACNLNHNDKIRLLIEYGTNIALNSKVISRKKQKYLKNIYEQTHSIEQAKEYIRALIIGNIKYVKSMLNSKYKVNEKFNIKGDHSALTLAVEISTLEIVKLLLSQPGIDVNITSRSYTPLMIAAEFGKTEVVKLLLSHPDVDINCQNENGFTALFLAIYNEHKEIVELLLKHRNIKLNLKNITGNSELQEAIVCAYGTLNFCPEEYHKYTSARKYKKQNMTITKEYKEIINLLLEHSDIEIINNQNNRGHTALMFATAANNKELVQKLLEKGADINLISYIGHTALGIAKHHKLNEIYTLLTIYLNKQTDKDKAIINEICYNNYKEVDTLLKEGANVNSKDGTDRTLLMFAANNGYTNLVKLLLSQKNIDIDAQDIVGSTALLRIAANPAYYKDRLYEETYKNRNIPLYHIFPNIHDHERKSASQNYIEIAKLLIDKGANVNIQDKGKRTALMRAAATKSKEIAKLLLNNPNTNVNLQEKNKFTALEIAVFEQDKDIVELLLKHKDIDVNKEDICGGTVLMNAIGIGNKDIIDLLLKHKKLDINKVSRIGATALLFAIKKNDAEIVKQLLKHPKINVNIGDSIGITPMTLAIGQSNPEIIKLLKKRGASIDKNPIISPLWIAILNENENSVKYLLKKGFNVNQKISGYTPLMEAVLQGNENLVKLLLDQKGIDIQVKNIFGETALDLAETNINRRRIAKLIRQKIGLKDPYPYPFINKKIPNSIDKINEKFFLAVTKGDLEEMNWLLEKKKLNGEALVDVNMKNRSGDTALIIAASNGNLDAVQMLIQYAKINNKDINSTDLKGNTALIRAAQKGHFDVVEELLAEKASINSSGQQKITALMAAAEEGHIRTVKLLLKNRAKVSLRNTNDETVLDIVDKKINNLKQQNALQQDISKYESIKKALEYRITIETNAPEEELLDQPIYWEVDITPCKNDLKFWEKNNPDTYQKIQELINYIKISPFKGIGRVERLKGDREGWYSRRINKKDRMEYEVDGEKVILKSCRGHYE